MPCRLFFSAVRRKPNELQSGFSLISTLQRPEIFGISCKTRTQLLQLVLVSATRPSLLMLSVPSELLLLAAVLELNYSFVVTQEQVNRKHLSFQHCLTLDGSCALFPIFAFKPGNYVSLENIKY